MHVMRIEGHPRLTRSPPLRRITSCVFLRSLGYGPQPPHIVASDARYYTAKGTDALFSL